jgi:hypothetical protein
LPPRKEIKKAGRALARRYRVTENRAAKLIGLRGRPMSFFELIAYHRANGTLGAFLTSLGLD